MEGNGFLAPVALENHQKNEMDAIEVFLANDSINCDSIIAQIELYMQTLQTDADITTNRERMEYYSGYSGRLWQWYGLLTGCPGGSKSLWTSPDLCGSILDLIDICRACAFGVGVNVQQRSESGGARGHAADGSCE